MPRLFAVFSLLALIGVAICGCIRSESYPKASLYKNLVRSHTSDARLVQAPYRIAVANICSPRETARTYGPVVAYLSKKLKHPAQLVLARSYAELNQMVGSGDAIAAFVCSRGYVDGHKDFGLELVAAPAFRGQPVYYCYVIVSADSKAAGLRDLRGLRFAFTERGSNTGCLVPGYQIRKLGGRPESFFSKLIYTGSHDRSIVAVRDKMVDGAAVDSLIYEQAVRDEPDLRSRMRILARYGPYGSPPVVVNPHAPEGFKAAMKGILLNMHKDREARELLDSLMANRFVAIDDSAYESVRAMIREVELSASQTRR